MKRVKKRAITIGAGLIIIFTITITGGLLTTNITSKNNLIKGNEDKNELQGEITFVSNRTDKAVEIQELIAQFEKENPDVKINLELMGDVEGILQRKASVGELPDVTLVPANISKSEYHKFFLNIDDLGFDDNNIYNYYMGTGDDGSLYCLNSSINWQGIIYNKDIFEEAGINNIPTTIEELFAACESIKEIGLTPIAINYSQAWTMNSWVDVIPHLFDNSLEANTLLKDKQILDIDGGMYKSLNLVREIVRKGYCEENLTNYDWQQFKNDMSNSKIGMTIWSSDFKYQLEEMGMDLESIGMFPIPETETVKIYGDYKFAISKKSDNKNVAKEFLKYIFEEDRYVNAVNTMSPLKESEKNTDAFNELQEYTIPIQFYSDYVYKESIDEIKAIEIFEEMKKEAEMDYQFVQRYIIDDDLNGLVEEVEGKWKTIFNNRKNGQVN